LTRIFDMSAPPSTRALADRVAGVTWYHSMSLPGGILTRGTFDTLSELARLPFPGTLTGKRCLDVATADGFWAFEMERRGAAEVIAINLPTERLDWPGHRGPPARPADVDGPSELRGFDIAHQALQSSVKWRELSVYDLNADLIEEFDFVFMGSLLCHLRDPVAALAAIGSVLRGELLSVDAISAPPTVLHPGQSLARFEAPGWPLWWVPNLRAYRELFGAAGLDIVESGGPFFLKRGPAYDHAFLVETPSPSGRALQGNLKRMVSARLGNLHAWVRAARPLQR
jgi:tRNA (mo5U34)-methyltransferase